ncbi:MAG: PepSY domain-containing protein [Actinomycetota bacterium]|nr:PepSY domain-containing protein [Actinomycetota bacterium]MDH5223796.1 PepSY domain-containing protein [Actinomycetota bacterium]MDH5313093.1 PepSY domain-containing protein [Actinomycetota bacterium]
MRTKTKALAATAAALVLAGGAATVSVATSSDDRPLEGSDLDRATAAALQHTGGGTVVDSEVGDGGAVYEVEVELDDGTVVEVQLDGDFKVSGSNVDDDGRENGSGDESGRDD